MFAINFAYGRKGTEKEAFLPFLCKMTKRGFPSFPQLVGGKPAVFLGFENFRAHLIGQIRACKPKVTHIFHIRSVENFSASFSAFLHFVHLTRLWEVKKGKRRGKKNAFFLPNDTFLKTEKEKAKNTCALVFAPCRNFAGMSKNGVNL